MKKIKFRIAALEHLERAKSLLTEDGVPHAKYACLELRHCIECLVYDHAQAYVKQTGNQIINEWVPKRVMMALKEVDPAYDSSRTFELGNKESGEPFFKGTDKRFSIGWAEKSYNTLGSFLHQPTVKQLSKKGGVHENLVRDRAEKIAAELDRILTSTFFNIVMNIDRSLECECGFKIVKSASFESREFEVECPSCGNLYEVRDTSAQKFEYREAKFSYECEHCKTKNWENKKRLKQGSVLTCGCGSKREVFWGPRLRPIGGSPKP